jgi:putative transposase
MISRPTYFNWTAKLAGATVADVHRTKALEAENTELKRMYVDLALENAAIEGVPGLCRTLSSPWLPRGLTRGL